MTDGFEQNPHALAIIAALDGLTVGDHEAPLDDDGVPLPPPYVIVYLLPGGTVDGPLGKPDVDRDVPFQLTAVGRLAAEARDYLDQAVAAITGQTVTVAGRAVYRCRPTEAAGQVQRDDDVQPPVFYGIARFSIFTTPTP